MILAGELVGTGAGFFFASEIAPALGWRWPFFLAAIPGAAFALVLWRWLPEPARGGQSWIELRQEALASSSDARRSGPEQGKSKRNDASEIIASETGAQARDELVLRQDPATLGLLGAIRYLLRIPTYTLLIVASSLAYYFFAGVRAFGMIYFTGHYGVSRSELGWLVVLVGLAALAGGIASGLLAERLLKRGWARIRIVLPGAALFVAAVMFGPAIWIKNVYVGVTLLALGAAALAAANPPIDAARLDIVAPSVWGRGEPAEWRCAGFSKAERRCSLARRRGGWAAGRAA